MGMVKLKIQDPEPPNGVPKGEVVLIYIDTDSIGSVCGVPDNPEVRRRNGNIPDGYSIIGIKGGEFLWAFGTDDEIAEAVVRAESAAFPQHGPGSCECRREDFADRWNMNHADWA